MRAGFFVGLTALEADPVQVVAPPAGGEAPSTIALATTAAERRRVARLAARLGLAGTEVMRRAVLIGTEVTVRLATTDLAAFGEISRQAQEALRVAAAGVEA